MQNAGSHVGKLSEFKISDMLDRQRVLHHARVCHQHSRYVCPVLIDIRLSCPCNDRSCYIRSSAREQADFSAFGVTAVKSRNNGSLMFCQLLGKSFVGLIGQESSSVIKEDQLLCIHKVISEICSDQCCRKIFTAAYYVILRASCLDISADLLKSCIHSRIHAEIFFDRCVSLSDRSQKCSIRNIVVYYCLQHDEHVRDLAVLAEPFARCGNDHVPSFRISFDNRSDLPDLISVSDR